MAKLNPGSAGIYRIGVFRPKVEVFFFKESEGFALTVR
jgi:hypothetical protein